jgi:hypothetical protein
VRNQAPPRTPLGHYIQTQTLRRILFVLAEKYDYFVHRKMARRIPMALTTVAVVVVVA